MLFNGSLVMAAFAPESDEPITEKIILDCPSSKDHIYQVEIPSLQGEQTEGGHVLTLDIVNTGNVDLTPQARSGHQQCCRRIRRKERA